MKIKQQKQLNLAQLIEYVWNNEVTDKSFICKEDGSECTVRHKVTINKFGKFNLDSHNYYKESDLFKVEIEEEITEDMEIEGLVELGSNNHGATFFQCDGSSINEQKDFDSKAFYILNDDLTLTLIWTREKGLVE